MPQVAGQFYPASAPELRKMIQGYLAQAREKNQTLAGDLLGLIVPHAGYPYSGPVAAHAFALLSESKIRRVVVLAPAHRRAYPVPALLDARAYRTPLGEIPIDREAVRQLAATGAARIDASAFAQEHALEVELPFLQVTLADFRLLPIMISRANPAAIKKLAAALHRLFPAPDTLFVASTDLSHDFLYPVAQAMDQNALRLISELNPEGLLAAYQRFAQSEKKIRLGQNGRPEPDCAQLCGLGPVLTLLYLQRHFGAAQVKVLDARNSGDISGDRKGRIVGYAALAMALAADRKKPTAAKEDFLGRDEKQALLRLARTTLTAYLEKGERKDFSPRLPKLNQPGAAFVTLKKDGQLRGCIGYLEPVSPLWQMIRDRAIDAAVHDSRFRPVKKHELSQLSIEISVLSPRVSVKNPLTEIVIGRDGVWLELNGRRGVFLPQVPVEQGWQTVEEYLDHLCRKAHVPQPGCWRADEAQLMRFSALVFSELE